MNEKVRSEVLHRWYGGRSGRGIAKDLHLSRKTVAKVIAKHQQQRVTGRVVNERINLPRETRRRLRAIEHHLATGRPASLNEQQMRGWRALRHMIEQPIAIDAAAGP